MEEKRSAKGQLVSGLVVGRHRSAAELGTWSLLIRNQGCVDCHLIGPEPPFLTALGSLSCSLVVDVNHLGTPPPWKGVTLFRFVNLTLPVLDILLSD